MAAAAVSSLQCADTATELLHNGVRVVGVDEGQFFDDLCHYAVKVELFP